jgi:NDP-sugar pyrophosphorylase family protein
MTLVIMAAGMGSRFGGLKQIEPVGPNGEFIIDYSIYDAIKAGFTKVVFIIKEENYDIFKETIGKRIEGKIDVEYVFQDIKNVPEGVKLPEDRVKPLGTGHAILSCKGRVNEPFAIINSDDFYGRDAYVKAANFLKEDTTDYAMIGYIIGNTLTENGSVKRGYCEGENGYLSNLIESTVYRDGDKVKVEPLDGRTGFYAEPTDLVSMNMFCFKPDMLDYLDEHFIDFFNKNTDKLDKCEYLIPDVVFERIENDNLKVRVVDTDAVWHGVTYKEDKEELVNYISSLIDNGEYPSNLY